ncbi:hypothetical protein KFL_002500015 [Klebsormidium nitens]|uniref:Uncharacterized protein n=1 Tax=Klebsormidium nitens TaxID=105231 RepID=A0A1Y1I5E3_KLENI|nr:hypothetical protein KFL_002500015 [Klebsormidium nitens]|eukprot:GAQ85703.1 hypothetical protein KFL_002500015 [Klebsormidium nitens]
MSSPARTIAEPPVTLSESSDSEDSDDIVVRSSEGTVDLRNYKRFAISGDNMNCFFMTAFVVATLNGEPLGGGEELAAQLRAGRRPIDLEKEGLKVRATIVAYLRDHKKRPIPPHLITSSRPPSKRRPLPTWEKLYQALRDEDDLTEFETYVDRMSQSGCWGGDFEKRVVWAMGHKETAPAPPGGQTWVYRVLKTAQRLVATGDRGGGGGGSLAVIWLGLESLAVYTAVCGP